MFASYNVVVILTNKFLRDTYYKKKGEIKMYSNYYNYNQNNNSSNNFNYQNSNLQHKNYNMAPNTGASLD